jgi:hypothetical protein
MKCFKSPRCLIEKATQIKANYPVVTVIRGQNRVNHAGKKGSRQVGPFLLPESRLVDIKMRTKGESEKARLVNIVRQVYISCPSPSLILAR